MKISNENDSTGPPIPNNQNFAASITNVEDNKTSLAEEESNIASEDVDVEGEGEDATAEENYNPINNWKDTINNWREETELTPKSQSDFDDNEEQKNKTKGGIPSVIFQFIDEP